MRYLMAAAVVVGGCLLLTSQSGASGSIVYLETGLENDSWSDWGHAGTCVNSLLMSQPGSMWQLVDEEEWPNLQIGARTGMHFLHVGMIVPETGYYHSCEKRTSSPSLNLDDAVNPVVEFWVAGSAEVEDELIVSVYETASPHRELYIGTVTGADLWDMHHFESFLGDEYTKYSFNFKHLIDDEGLDGWVLMRWTFKSDALFEQGPGWNIDDIIVKEA